MISNKIIKFPQLESTNNYLIKNLHLDNGTVIVTDNQYAGHGSGKNTWESAANKNLTFSILLKPTSLEVSNQFFLNIIISLAIQHYVIDTGIQNCKIKWPNDIYVNDKKLCGILINNTIMATTINTVVAGIGININQKQFTSNAPNPTSLTNLTNQKYSLEKELNKIIKYINHYFNALERHDFQIIKEEYLNNLYRKDTVQNYIFEGKKIKALIRGISEFGLLILEETDGTLHTCDFKQVKYII